MNHSQWLSQYRFCPSCGSDCFQPDSLRSMRCQHCGYQHFVNTSGAVAVWIENDRAEVLVCRRRYAPSAGTLDLPGGFIEPGETAEEAACREVFEETQLHISQPLYAFSLPNTYQWNDANIPTIDLFFHCRCVHPGPVRAADDAEACIWMPVEHIDAEQFGLLSVRQGVRRFLASERKSLYI